MIDLFSDLRLGDCLDVMAQLEPGSVDAVICDPPYGTTACKWDAVIPFEPMWEQVWRVLKPKGVAVLMASQPFTSALVMSQPKTFRQALAWAKNKPFGHLNAKRRHMTAHEEVLLFSRSGASTYNPQKTTGHSPANYARSSAASTTLNREHGRSEYAGGNSDRYPTTVLRFDVVNNDGSNGGRSHPTQKPVALMEYMVKTYTNEGETVLDFTMGSGTTGVACVNLDRRFIGIERDAEYFEAAQKRIEEAEAAWALT